MGASNIETVIALLAALGSGSGASGLLVLLDPYLSLMPSLRPSDKTRSAGLHLLLFALNIALLAGLAYTQHIVISMADLPTLLIAAGGGTGYGKILYSGISNKVNAAPAPSAPSAAAVLDKASAALAATQA